MAGSGTFTPLLALIVACFSSGCGREDSDEAALHSLAGTMEAADPVEAEAPGSGLKQPPAPELGQDPALVGTWVNEAWSRDGSLMDLSVMTFHADGRASLGETRGYWKTAEGILFTREESYPQLVPMMRYHIEHGRMIVYYRDGTTGYWAKK